MQTFIIVFNILDILDEKSTTCFFFNYICLSFACTFSLVGDLQELGKKVTNFFHGPMLHISIFSYHKSLLCIG